MRYLFSLADPSNFDIPQTVVNNNTSTNIFQIVFAIAGGVALIVLMLAGLKYVTSQGDPSAVAKAKNTIIYALIGLMVSALAFTIVAFVVRKV